MMTSAVRYSRRLVACLPRQLRLQRTLHDGRGLLVDEGALVKGRGGPTWLGGRHCSSTMLESQPMADYLNSPYPDIDVMDNVPLHAYMLNAFSKYGNAVALVDGLTGKEMTYAQLQTNVVKVASALIALGFGRGKVATIYSQNSPEYLVMFLAIGATGGSVSTVNPMYTPDELKKAVNLTKSTIMICSPELLPNVKDIPSNCPSIEKMIVLGTGAGCVPYSSLLDADMSLFPTNLDIDCKQDVFAIPFSSGTTGLPKGVMLTHSNLVANIIQTRQPSCVSYVDDKDCVLSVLPFFHIYGQIVVAMVGLASGVKIVSLPKFDPGLYLQSIQKHAATFLHIVPPLMLFLAKHPVVSKFDLSSVREMTTGAAPCGPETMQEVCARLNNNVLIRQGYGLTESSPLTHCNSQETNKYHTCGTAIANTQFKMIDIETGKSLDRGETGELLVRGPQVMKGYFENEKETAHTLRDGWLHTGDIGHYDEDGHVVIVDRIKELIKVKGLQVAPAELEALLVSHPLVADAAVIGRPDERLGEAPLAFVVLKADVKPSEETKQELDKFVSDRVAPYKRLVGGIQFRGEIPKAVSGKILRRVLKAEL